MTIIIAIVVALATCALLGIVYLACQRAQGRTNLNRKRPMNHALRRHILEQILNRRVK